MFVRALADNVSMNAELSPPAAPVLEDRFGRRISYLRISVTDRCDLRCSYCMPKHFKGFAEPAEWLNFAEIQRVVSAFASLGVSRIRLTGGEPLLRRNLVDLVAGIHAIPGIHDLSLSTNATQLAKHAAALRQAGLSRVNVSLDSLDRACMQTITGRDSLASVLAGLQQARAVGFQPIKLNMVVQKGINAHEVMAMTEFCIQQGFILRLIEAMPMGSTGQNTAYMPLEPLRQQIVERFQLHAAATEIGGGPARYWSSADGQATVGFIHPISQHFCATCNRVRLTVDGCLYLCLGQEHSLALRPLLRAGISDTELQQVITQAIELKPEKHEFTTKPTQIVRFMSQTGG